MASYQHLDHLGSPVAETKADGSLAWRERYTPYGEKLDNPEGNKDNQGFTGHIQDNTTGLTYMQARYYDPVTGRFLSINPVQFSANMPFMFNRYAYVGGDPVNATDPDGQVPVLIPVVIFVGKEIAGEAFTQATGLPAPTVKGAAKAVVKSRAKRRAAREAQRKANIPTSKPGEQVQNKHAPKIDRPRDQIKEGTSGKKDHGVVDGSKDKVPDTDDKPHPPHVEAGPLKTNPINKHGRVAIQEGTKVKSEIDKM